MKNKLKKLFCFIKKANQVFFFLGVIGFAVFIAAITISSLLRVSRPDPGVQIIEVDENKEKPKVELIKTFLAKKDDLFIFGVRSHAIVKDTSKSDKVMNLFDGGGYSSSKLINLIFIEGEAKRMLLDKDALIYDFILEASHNKRVSLNRYDYQNQYHVSKNIFLIVEEDSNKDGFLSEKDNANLYISSADGTNLNKISERVTSYELVDEDLVLYKTKTDEEVRFHTLNLETLGTRAFDTSI